MPTIRHRISLRGDGTPFVYVLSEPEFVGRLPPLPRIRVDLDQRCEEAPGWTVTSASNLWSWVEDTAVKLIEVAADTKIARRAEAIAKGSVQPTNRLEHFLADTFRGRTRYARLLDYDS